VLSGFSGKMGALMDGTQPAAAGSVEPIPPERLRERIASGDGAFVLDVRSARVYEAFALELGPNDRAAGGGWSR
jgi:hypothetical protein